MKKFCLLLSCAIIISACQKTDVKQKASDINSSSSSNFSSSFSSISSFRAVIKSEESTGYVNCKTVDATLPFDQWHTLKSDTLGFEMRYPGFVESSRDDYIRLENFNECEYDPYSLEPGQYYSEISPLRGGTSRKCNEYSKNLTKVTLQSGWIGWKGMTLERDAMGDSGGNIFTLCVEAPKGDITFFVTESSDTGILANQIFNSIGPIQ